MQKKTLTKRSLTSTDLFVTLPLKDINLDVKSMEYNLQRQANRNGVSSTEVNRVGKKVA